MNRLLRSIPLFFVFTALLAACGAPPPPPPPPVDQPDAGPPTTVVCEGDARTDDVSACMPLATDYQPRVNMSAGDTWPACISDDNVFHPLQMSISTVARVEAFDQIAAKLWRGGVVPSAQDFLDARVLYAQDQGLDSRVQRREDVHYPPPAGGAKCSEAGIPDQFPDRCVGPAKLLPILNDAFAAGARGEAPLLHARRIEAALVWFLYVSALSEVSTCTTKAQDCDSAWAYYSGGTARGAPAGFAAYVSGLSDPTHQRAYDATLAVRCWRNLDNEQGTAMDLMMRDRALGQLDAATVRGVALIVRDRFTALDCGDDAAEGAQLAFLQIVVPLLDRAARAVDPAKADVLKAQAAKSSPAEVDVAAATAALDALFPCP